MHRADGDSHENDGEACGRIYPAHTVITSGFADRPRHHNGVGECADPRKSGGADQPVGPEFPWSDRHRVRVASLRSVGWLACRPVLLNGARRAITNQTQAGPVIELTVFCRCISLFAGEYGWEFFGPFE